MTVKGFENAKLVLVISKYFQFTPLQKLMHVPTKD